MSGYGTVPFGSSPFGAGVLGGDQDVTINESVALVQAAMLTGVGVSRNDALAVTQQALVQSTASALSSLNLAESFDFEEVYALSEHLALTGAPTALTLRLATLTEALGFTETLRPVMLAVLSDTFDLDAAETYEFSVLASLVDSLIVSGVATNTVTAMALVTETLALISVATSIQDGTLSDDFDLADVLTARLTAMEQIVASAVFSDSSVGLAVATVEISDDLDLDDNPSGLATVIAALRDGLRLAMGFVFDDTPVIALSLNAATKGLTTYSQFPFNSMAAFGGAYYGAADGGLYGLEGTTDAGSEIVWRIRTGLSNLGTGRNKAMDAAYLGFTASGRVALKCIVVSPSTGEKIVHWYELTETAAVTPRGRRLLVGRGLRSVYWGFELTNVTAGDIELDVIELHPIVLEGRLS